MINPTKLVAYGCSFTEGSEIGDAQFGVKLDSQCFTDKDITVEHAQYRRERAWPAKLANMMKAESINHGYGGNGNDSIATKLYATLPGIVAAEQDPSNVLVVICWSQLPRVAMAQSKITNRFVPCTMADMSKKEFLQIYHMDDPNNRTGSSVNSMISFLTGVWNTPNNVVQQFFRLLVGVVNTLNSLGVRWYMCWAMQEHPSLYGMTEFTHDDLEENPETNSLREVLDGLKVHQHWYGDFHFRTVRSFIEGSSRCFYSMTRNMKLPRGPNGHPLELAHLHWAMRLYGAMIDQGILEVSTKE